MNNMNSMNPREDKHARHPFPEPPMQVNKRPWHSQGWVWMIVVLIALVTIVLTIGGLSDQVANVNDSIQQQTAAIRHQNHILDTLDHGLNRIEIAITNGVDRVVTAIDDLINKIA